MNIHDKIFMIAGTVLLCVLLPIVIISSLYFGWGDCGYYECPAINTWGKFLWLLDHKHDHCVEDIGSVECK